jgi:hypothetical protein
VLFTYIPSSWCIYFRSYVVLALGNRLWHQNTFLFLKSLTTWLLTIAIIENVAFIRFQHLNSLNN